MILGLGSSVYELIILRSYFPLMEARKVPVVDWFSKTAATGRANVRCAIGLPTAPP